VNPTAARRSRRSDAGVAARKPPSKPAPAPPDAALSTGQLAAAALLPVLAAIVAYLPALQNGFIWDDPLVLEQLRAIHGVRDLFVLPPAIPHLYYRPVIFITYLADRWIGSETPYWFHVSVIACHALNTLLVFALARRLFPRPWLLASGSALLFAVFPTHVESVAWMAGRSDVIVCAFLLLTVLLSMDHERPWSCWLAGVTFLLALLSKEMALAGLVLVPVLDALRLRRAYWSRYVPLLIVTLIYLMLRQHGTGGIVGGMPTGLPPQQLVADVVRALGFYVLQALLPLHLSAYVPEVPNRAAYFGLGFAAVVASLAAGAVVWRRPSWPLAFLLAWFWMTLAPSLTVIVRHSASAAVADRYLYVPTVASCLLIVWGLQASARRWHLTSGALATVLLGLCLACAAQLVAYTAVWANDLTFWSDVAAKSPGYALPHRELASALLERGRLKDAEDALQQALAAKSEPEGLAMTYNNLGNLYRRLERYDDAEHAFRKGLQIAPHPMLYHNLGMALMKRIELENQRGDLAAVMRDLAQARTAFETAISMAAAPDAPDEFKEWNAAKSHALLGQILFSLHERDAARQHLETSLRLEPTGPVADATRQYMRRLQ
jgi:tetratricopeptide (TPR) repeat protein